MILSVKHNWLEVVLIFVIIIVVSYIGVYYKDWVNSQKKKSKSTNSNDYLKSSDSPKRLIKEQIYHKKPMRDTLKSMIRERMIRLVKETYQNNPMKGSPLEGLVIHNAIGTASKKYKEHFLKERHKLGMSEDEINSVIDEVTAELLEQFLE